MGIYKGRGMFQTAFGLDQSNKFISPQKTLYNNLSFVYTGQIWEKDI